MPQIAPWVNLPIEMPSLKSPSRIEKENVKV
jgi:hypothetical protein